MREPELSYCDFTMEEFCSSVLPPGIDASYLPVKIDNPAKIIESIFRYPYIFECGHRVCNICLEKPNSSINKDMNCRYCEVSYSLRRFFIFKNYFFPKFLVSIKNKI